MVEHKSYSNDEELQAYILKALSNSDHLDSDTLITEVMGAQLVDAALKSLLVDNYVALEVVSKQKIELSEEGAEYAAKGTPEYQYAKELVLD